jgi:hypothetical protein
LVSGDVEETKQVSILFQIIHNEIVDAVDFVIAQFMEHHLDLIENIFMRAEPFTVRHYESSPI